VIRRRSPEGERGQGLVEFSLLVPVFTLLLLAMLEFGFVFDHLLTIQYSTREGARVGAALASGGTSLDCNDVDQHATRRRRVQSRGSHRIA
jgi:Flp pilus assembly protein TadG